VNQIAGEKSLPMWLMNWPAHGHFWN